MASRTFLDKIAPHAVLIGVAVVFYFIWRTSRPAHPAAMPSVAKVAPKKK